MNSGKNDMPIINRAMQIITEVKQIIATADSVEKKLEQVLRSLIERMYSHAGACFLRVDNTFEVFSALGYKDDFQNISLKEGESLVGNIVQASSPLIVEDVWHNSSFSYRPDIGLEEYKSFIGVPLRHADRINGVIILQHKEIGFYTLSDAELLETIALVLDDWFSSEEVVEYKNSLEKYKENNGKEKYKGISLSKGIGVGTAIVHNRHRRITKIIAEDKEKELCKLQIAHTKMNQDLDEKFNSAKLGIGEHVDILDTYRMFAKDKGWYKKIADNINGGLTAEAAVERAYEDMWKRLSETTDNYMRERLHDLRDITDRLLGYIYGDNGDKQEIKEAKDLIVVAQTMGPADLMDYDYNKIRGLIIEDGTPTMHVAIVAKALGIPVVSKIKGICKEIKSGETVGVDGDNGYVFIRPSLAVRQKFVEQLAEKERLQKKLATLRRLPAKTKDDIRVNLYLNIGLNFDLDYINSTNCDGIGLYRTEIPFMASDTMPDVEQQTQYYKELLDKSGRKRVVFRSLDVGSDKLLPYWRYGGEENPAIGWRSIRITLDRRAILRQQMRAFIRAAEGKELNVMFPMISNLSEFQEAKETLMIELEKEKKRTGKEPKKVNVGLMIEVPSVVFQLEDILPEADFISVGTNDLAQFVFACDRGNPRLIERYDVLSAPFLRILQAISVLANNAGVYCSVCGEMASNPIEALALLGLGYRNLSMSGSAFGKVKSMVRSTNIDEISDYMNILLKSNRRTVRPQLISYANDHGIEIY